MIGKPEGATKGTEQDAPPGDEVPTITSKPIYCTSKLGNVYGSFFFLFISSDIITLRMATLMFMMYRYDPRIGFL